MRLLDTNVIVYALDESSPFNQWAVDAIADAVKEGGPGAAINAVTLAELCAEPGTDETLVAGQIMSWGVAILDVPARCADVCGAAFRAYVQRRKSQGDKNVPKVPLPDFFIGAHALTERMDVVTNDPDRIRVYFPKVNLLTPKTLSPPASRPSGGSN